jgi:hypothetical protein
LATWRSQSQLKGRVVVEADTEAAPMLSTEERGERMVDWAAALRATR